LAFSGLVKQSEKAVPISSSRGIPVTLTVASLASVILPSGLIATNESKLDSIMPRAASKAWAWLVTSRAIVDAPTTWPSVSQIGEKLRETGNSLPSFRMRMVSK